MNHESLLLVGAVAGVGLLHTIVPDHWVPITLIARQRGWSKVETARASFQAGVGHVLSTLAIGLVVLIAGVAFATWFGNIVNTVASVALVAFGGWIMISALREIRGSGVHGHSQGHSHGHSHDFSRLGGYDHMTRTGGVHGPELQRIETGHGALELSIFEDGVPPRFRLTGAEADFVWVETVREGGMYQSFAMANRGGCWESLDEIPEPHGFKVKVVVDHGGHAHFYTTVFAEHAHGEHGHDHGDSHGDNVEPANDALYAPLSSGAAVLVRHVHTHRHGSGPAHRHLHDHEVATAHEIAPGTEAVPPLHIHKHKTSSRTALLLILGFGQQWNRKFDSAHNHGGFAGRR